MLPTKNRVTRQKDFSHALTEGRFFRWKYGYYWIVNCDNQYDCCSQWGVTAKFGVIIPKKVGNSVVRHTSARYIRQVFHQLLSEINIPVIIIVKLQRSAPYTKIFSSLYPAISASLRSMHGAND